MKIKLLFVLLFSLAASVNAQNSGDSAKADTAASASNQGCETNFTMSGSFLSGRKYQTFQDFPKVKFADAFKRAYTFTTKNGFTVTDHDKELGVISATQSVSYGKGKTVPLTINVEDLKPSGVKVTIGYATSGGVTSPLEAIKKHFCATMAAIEN